MSNKEKPLPKLPSRAFNARASEQDEQLLSDRMAAAIAEGRLEEFLKEELPDNEQARSLAMMMLGMTGMLPQGTRPLPKKQGKEEKPLQAAGEIAGDVLRAVQGGDVKGLMGLLRREHQKRAGTAEPIPEKKPPPLQTAEQPVIEQDIIDELIKLAADNNVSIEWVILRAVRMYVEEYRKTGKL